MARQHLMSGKDSVTGARYAWASGATPDFAGVGYPGPNAATNVYVQSLYDDGTGVPGPAGEDGDPGPAGSPGAPGADGSNGTMVTVAVDYCSTDAALTLSGSQTVDGAVVPSGKRVLKAPVAGSVDSGIWVTAVDAWTRATDADSSAEIDARPLIQIKNGATLAGRVAILSTPAPITLGVTVLTYQVSLKAPATADAGKFARVDPNGDFVYAGVPLEDSNAVVLALLATGALKFSASLRLDTDADGKINISRSDVINVCDYPYNAVASTTTTTATGTSGNAAITLAAGTSFAKRHGVTWLGAGTAHSAPAPATPTAQVVGTPGSLDRRYRIVARLEGLGMSAQSAEVTCTAPDCLTDSIGAFLIRVDWATSGNIASFSAVPSTQDGITIRVGNDVLVWQQTAPAENGIYRVSADNQDGTFTLVRGASMDTAGEATRGRRVHVSSGTTYSGKYYRLSSASVTTLGTDPIVFEEVAVRLRPYGAVCDGVVKVNVSNLAAFATAQPGYTVANGYRILLTAQTTTSQNGVYTASGAGGGTCTLTRDTAFDTAAELPLGSFFRIARGDDALSCWFVTTAAATLGTNPLLFTQVQVYQWDVYGRTGAGSYDYLGAMIANPLRDSAPGNPVLYDVYFDDIGAGAVSRPFFVPSSPPAASRANSHRARILTINGTAVTLDAAPATSVTGADFRHDNYQAFADAMAAAAPNTRIEIAASSTDYPVYGNIVEDKKLAWNLRGATLRMGASFGWECAAGAAHGTHEGLVFKSETATLPCGGKYVSHDPAHFHGAMVLIRVRSYWDECFASSSTATLTGTGFAIVGRDVNGDNANCTKLSRCYADSCSGHGFVAYGSDVNQSVFDDCSSTSAEGWGFFDASFLGLKIQNCHASNCQIGPYCTESITAISKWDQCYSEAGQGAANIGTNTRVSGGDHGAGFWNPYTGALTQGTYQNPFIVSTGSPIVQRYVGSKNDNLVDRYSSRSGFGLDFRSGVENVDKIRHGYFNTQITGGGFVAHGRNHEGNGQLEFQATLWVSSGYSAGAGGGSNRVKIASVSASGATPSFPNAAYKQGSFYFDSTGTNLGFQITANFALTSSTWAAGVAKNVGNIVKPTTPNGYAYVATAVSGTVSGTTHATTEPTWPTVVGNTVVDNGVTWVCYGADAAAGNYAVR